MSAVYRLLEKTADECYFEGRLEAGNNIVQCSPFINLGPFEEMVCACRFLVRGLSEQMGQTNKFGEA